MRLRHYSVMELFQRRLAAPRRPMLLPHGSIPKAHSALHPSSFCPAPRSCHPTHSVTSRFTQTTKPSQEPRNKKSVLTATFLRLAIVPSRQITDRSAKAQVTCHKTSDSCFPGAKESCQSQKKLQKHLDFCFENGRICRSRTNPAKDRLPTTATKSIPRNGGYRATHHQRLNPISFLNDSHP